MKRGPFTDLHKRMRDQLTRRQAIEDIISLYERLGTWTAVAKEIGVCYRGLTRWKQTSPRLREAAAKARQARA